MKAIRIHGWGLEPRIDDVDDPVGTSGHSIVRVEAATVGHIDRTIWSGAFIRPPALPYTPGVEGSGTVVASDAFAVGSRVWIRGGGLGVAVDGTWSEMVTAPDTALGVLPDDVDFAIGSAFFSPCASAWIALHDIGEVRHGERVVVTGASGAVGALTCQLALEAGAEVTGVVSSPRSAALLVDGVSALVVDRADPVCSQPLEADLLIDTVGGRILTTMLPRVAAGGRAVLVGYLAGTDMSIDIAAFIQRDVALLPLNMLRREQAGRQAAPELLKRIASGQLRVDVQTFARSQAGDALRWLVEANHRGRAVLLPQQPPVDPARRSPQ